MFKIKKGTIVKVYPSKKICIVKNIRDAKYPVVYSESFYQERVRSKIDDLWIGDYWGRVHGRNVYPFKKVITINFPSSVKNYDYPKHKKALKRVLGQRAARKRFNKEFVKAYPRMKRYPFELEQLDDSALDPLFGGF